jgi:hypothetical protein
MAKKKDLVGPLEAQKLEALIRRRGDYGHIEVRERAGHLVIESREGEDTRTIARLTPLEGGLYGLSFCKHTGKWERMPFTGPMEKIADDLLATLAPYLQHMDF